MGQIEYSQSTDKLGKAVVKYFRDEIYQGFLDEKEHIINMGMNEFINQMNSKTMVDELKNPIIEKAKLFCELTKEQNEVLDRLLLSLLDSVTFNVMRALDENDNEKTGIELKVDEKDVKHLRLIGNGMLSGEIFDWFPRFSKFGQYQF